MQMKTRNADWMKVARKLVKPVTFDHTPNDTEMAYYCQAENISSSRYLGFADPSDHLIQIYKALPWTKGYIVDYRGKEPCIAYVVFRYDPHYDYSIKYRQSLLVPHQWPSNFRFDGRDYETVTDLKQALRAKAKRLKESLVTVDQILEMDDICLAVQEDLSRICVAKRRWDLKIHTCWDIIPGSNTKIPVYVTLRELEYPVIAEETSQRRMRDLYRIFDLCWYENGEFYERSYTPDRLISALRRRLKKMGRLDEVKL